MPYMSIQRYFGLGLEATRGTAVAPTVWLPIDNAPTLEPMVSWLKDEGLRGSPLTQYADVPSYRHDEFSFKGNLFPDSFPVVMAGALGTDVVTGTVAPYTHTIGLDNQPTSGSQPQSYTGVDTDWIQESGGPAKQFTAGQIDTVSISFSADGALTYSSKYLGDAFTQVAAPTSAFSTTLFVPAWSGAVTVAGSPSSVVAEGSIDIKRSTAPVYTLGTQSPYRLWAGACDVSGKLTFVAESGSTVFTNALTANRIPITFTFTEPVSGDTVLFQMSACQLKNPKVTGDKAWEQITVDFTAEGNTTDAVQGGFSNILFKGTNAISTAFG
jgi:hypothetical protein